MVPNGHNNCKLATEPGSAASPDIMTEVKRNETVTKQETKIQHQAGFLSPFN